MSPIRVLYLASSLPQGPSFSGQLRALQIERALRQIGQVRWLVVSADAGKADAARPTSQEFEV